MRIIMKKLIEIQYFVKTNKRGQTDYTDAYKCKNCIIVYKILYYIYNLKHML